MMGLCSRCNAESPRPNGRYCRRCHATYEAGRRAAATDRLVMLQQSVNELLAQLAEGRKGPHKAPRTTANEERMHA